MLMGRDDEQRAVRAVLDDAQEGRASVLLLVGMPGIGKSSLLDLAESLAGDRGMSVWRLTAVEAESGISGSGLSLLASSSGAEPATLANPWGLLSTLTDAAAVAPVLLAIDDAHWLDETSLTTLGFVCRRLQDDAVAVVMTARPEIDRRPELDGVPRTEVEPLSEAAAAELLMQASPTTPPDVAREIAASLGCVPLALVEAPVLLAPEMLDGRAAVTSPLPVGRSITARYARGIDALPAATRRALVIASASDSGSAAVVAEALQVAGLAPADLVPAHEAGLVLLGEGVQFRHPLVRSAVHAAARDSERRDAHLVLAAVAGSRGDEDSRLRHASAAALGPDEELASGLEARAYDVAQRRGSAAAAATLERAAELSPSSTDRWRRLVSSVELMPSAPASARHAREVLEQCADPELRARVAMVLADDHLPVSEGVPLLDDVLRDLPRGELAEAVVSLKSRVCMHQLDLESLGSIERLLAAWEDDEPLTWRCAGMLGEIATFRGAHADAARCCIVRSPTQTIWTRHRCRCTRSSTGSSPPATSAT